MPSPIKLHVWGDYACFTRPEMKVERVSYDVITPSAARGILEAIYWKPEIRWVVERLHVLKPIRFTNIRRNEVASKIPLAGVRKAIKGDGSPLGMDIESSRQQRAAMVLRDVAYAVEARFELLGGEDPVEKHYNIFKRRAEKGQCFHRPYLGCREFPADFAWIGGDIPKTQLPAEKQDNDFGYMLHDLDYVADKKGPIVDGHSGKKLRAEPRFFRAEMTGGIIEVPPLDHEEVTA
jgi:CRISPR-associated protein Cas5d